MFVPVMLAAPAAPDAPPMYPRVQAPARGLIEIELVGGRRVRLSGPVYMQALMRVIGFLEGR